MISISEMKAKVKALVEDITGQKASLKPHR